MRRIATTILLLALIAPAATAQPGQDIAPLLDTPALDFNGGVSDWMVDEQTRRSDWLVGMAKVAGMTGAEAAAIAARPGADGRGGILRASSPIDAWRGKRVRLSGRLKSEDVERLQMWLRITGPSITQQRHYDMAEKPIRGTTDWQRHEIVMDVPEDARAFDFGFYIEGGKGKAFGDAFTLEAVGSDVALTPLAGIGRDGWQRRDDEVTRTASTKAIANGARARWVNPQAGYGPGARPQVQYSVQQGIREVPAR